MLPYEERERPRTIPGYRGLSFPNAHEKALAKAEDKTETVSAPLKRAIGACSRCDEFACFRH
jgi:hypothetical protein